VSVQLQGSCVVFGFNLSADIIGINRYELHEDKNV